MIDMMRQWWLGLAARERVLVGIAGALAATVISWFAIITPLANGLDGARDAHRIAAERHATIMARVETATALQNSASGAAPSVTGQIDLVISQSAAEQGFILSRNDAVGRDGTSIAIGSARSAALLGWLGVLEQQGLIAKALSLRPNADGTVAMTATIERVR